jgi:serine/threonine protein kinase
MLKNTKIIGPCFVFHNNHFFFIFLFFSFLFSDITIKTLGKGREGTMYVAKHKETNNEYAMKEIFVKDAKDTNNVKHIIEIIRQLPSSPYIVKYFNSFKSTQNVYILIEYCRGYSLQEFIQKRPSDKPLVESVCFFFFFFILCKKSYRMFFAFSITFFYVSILCMRRNLCIKILTPKTSSLMM